MLVFNIQHFSTHDGPGIRTVIFLKGCPLDCAWCHNPEGKGCAPELSFDSARCIGCGKCRVCPMGAHMFDENSHRVDRTKCTACGECAKICPAGALELVGKEYTVPGLLAEAAKDSVFYGNDGGVTISGGEPFAQFDELLELLKALRANGINTAVETSGFTSPEKLTAAAEYVDLFLYDCKLTDEELSRKYTGVGFGEVSAGLSLLDRLGAKVVLRCPIIPGVNDDSRHIGAIAGLCEKHGCITSAELEPYHPLGLRKYAAVGRAAAYTYDKRLDESRLSALLDELGKLTAKPVCTNK